jgi:APA family basic amino acid/polyamine antiporter
LQDAPSQRAPQKRLTLFDSTCLIVGIIVGAGIYQMAPNIAKGAHDGWGVLLIWIAGGLISLCGALGICRTRFRLPAGGR